MIIAAGKFHGVMAAQTPTGCLMVMRRRPGAGRAWFVHNCVTGFFGKPLDKTGGVNNFTARFGEWFPLLQRHHAR
ncbi:hypothetical protein P4S72_27480 [Vibrio sp. PP-XX7]